MPDHHGVLRGRRSEPSDEVPLIAAPAAIHESKMHAVRIARPDGKHLTVDDYQWIRRCLGLRDDGDVAPFLLDPPTYEDIPFRSLEVGMAVELRLIASNDGWEWCSAVVLATDPLRVVFPDGAEQEFRAGPRPPIVRRRVPS